MKTEIDEMVDHFLQWKLPADFAPDCGISYTPNSQQPIGTNLLTAIQAREMIEHLLTIPLRAPDVKPHVVVEAYLCTGNTVHFLWGEAINNIRITRYSSGKLKSVEVIK